MSMSPNIGALISRLACCSRVPAPNATVLGGEMGGRTSPAADWLTEMTEGFKPVSDSTSGALNELADAFPLEGDPGL